MNKFKEFINPENLHPPDWKSFWRRYVLMILVGIAFLFLIPGIRPYWFSWDIETRLVSCFGVHFRQQVAPAVAGDASLAAFQDFVNTILHLALSLVFLVYVTLARSIYGWRRCVTGLRGSNVKRVLLYIGVLLPGVVLAGQLAEYLGVYSGDPVSAAPHGKSAMGLCAVLCMTMLIPLGEEIFVRFTLFQSVRSRFSFIVAALAASVVFGLMHFGYPDHRKILTGCLVSVLWCWTYERTGSILTPIGIHVGNDPYYLIVRQIST